MPSSTLILGILCPQPPLRYSLGLSICCVSQSDATRAAWELLQDFTRKEFRGVAQEPYLSSPAARQRLREALMVWLGLPCCKPSRPGSVAHCST